MKIYVVTDGIYSDYHIVGVFVDKTKASLLANNVGGDVENYDTDDYEDVTVQLQAGRQRYCVWIGPRGGVNVNQVYYYDGAPSDSISTGRYVGCNSSWQCFVWAEDEDHAIKHALDRTRIAKAEGRKEW